MIYDFVIRHRGGMRGIAISLGARSTPEHDRRIPQQGDVYRIDPHPIAGRELKNRYRFVVITPKAIL